MNVPFAQPTIAFRRVNARSLRLLAVHAAIFAAALFIAFFTRSDFSVESYTFDDVEGDVRMPRPRTANPLPRSRSPRAALT